MYKIFFPGALDIATDEELKYVVDKQATTEAPTLKPEGTVAIHVKLLDGKSGADLREIIKTTFDWKAEAEKKMTTLVVY